MGTTVKVAGNMVILVLIVGLVYCGSGVTTADTTPTPTSVTTTHEDSNGAKIFLVGDSSYNYYKVPIPDGITLVQGTIPVVCRDNGMEPLCSSSDNSHPWNVAGCISLAGERQTFYLLAELLGCEGSNDGVKMCEELHGVFVSVEDSFGECGVMVDRWCVSGKLYTSGSGSNYHSNTTFAKYWGLCGIPANITTTTTTMMTTTTTTTTTMTTMTTDCGSDGIPALNTVTRRRRVGSGLECQEYCAGIQGAEYFKWKKIGAKVCWCIKLGIKPRDNFEGGYVTCDSKLKAHQGAERDCGSDGISALNTVAKKKRVESGLECQEYCAGIQGAEYFKRKKTGAKVCWCIKLGIKARNNFESGPVTC